MTVDEAIAVLPSRHPPRRRRLIAVSGGRDSMTLLHSLHAAGWKLVVCHLDHGLRGRAARTDAAFVRNAAASYGLACECGSADVRADARQCGLSVEAAGRAARHRFLAECARRHRCYEVFMAHHADDQVETVLMNLLRGASGLRGMKEVSELRVAGAKRPLCIIRPLLSVPREEINRWIDVHAVQFREDATNAEAGGLRNRVRHELLPVLLRLAGRDVRPALLRAALVAAEEDEFLGSLAGPHAATKVLAIKTLRDLPVTLQRRVLHLWLQARGVPRCGFQEVEAARDMLDPSRGPPRLNLPGNCFLRRKAGKLWIE